MRAASVRSGETQIRQSPTWRWRLPPSQIKIGCIHHGERLAKYNQLLRIAERVGG